MATLPEGVQVLRGQIVRRLPTRAELLRRKPIVVTERDRAILAAVFDFGSLTTELIARAFFPEAGDGRRAPPSTALERVRALWLWSFLDRLELPVARVLGGRRPFLYTLGTRGVPVVEQERGAAVGAVRRRRLDRLDHRFLEHDLAVATFWAALVEALAETPVTLARWVPERTLRAWRLRAVEPTTGAELPVLPDGMGELRSEDGRRWAYLVEVDLGTATLGQVRRKVRALELWRAGGGLGQRLGHDDLTVVVLTKTWARLVQLWQAARREVSPGRWGTYRFGLLDQLARPRVAGQPWLNLADQTGALLPPDALGDPAGPGADAPRAGTTTARSP
jgi:hypothetical protein